MVKPPRSAYELHPFMARKSPTPPPSPPPRFVKPQLALAVDAPPAGERWCHEIKFDGYRLHARIDGDDIRLLTRTGLDWSKRYGATIAALRALPLRAAYIDGELCALRPDGTPSFAALQAAMDNKATDRLVYFVFDLLFLDGQDLMRETLRARKRKLQALLQNAPDALRYTEHITGNGAAFLEAARGLKVEGVLSKLLDAPYKPGERGTWRKCKVLHAEEFVVVGFTDPEGARPYFGALLLGYYDARGRLHYAGRVGSGIGHRELKRLYDKIAPLATKKMPLSEPPPKTAGRFAEPLELRRVHWIEPQLVAAVEYLTWTEGGVLRAVTYQGLREDKPAREVVRAPPG
jgi:bifunctional non-homologous end joining protein LigD